VKWQSTVVCESVAACMKTREFFVMSCQSVGVGDGPSTRLHAEAAAQGVSPRRVRFVPNLGRAEYFRRWVLRCGCWAVGVRLWVLGCVCWAVGVRLWVGVRLCVGARLCVGMALLVFGCGC
jgi:hypothetical protein